MTTSVTQVHSITARSVSREFRDGLKMAKPEFTDTIFKLPKATQKNVTQETVIDAHNPYQDGKYIRSSPEYIRTSSPEYKCILAMPALIIS